jgi:antitoxin component of RelBE/YafQ-DinJ toxin-antitoxin module
MIKEKDILIRITPELKKKVQERAKKLGLSVSAYIRMILIKEVDDEQ